MTSTSIIAQIKGLRQHRQPRLGCNLHGLAADESRLPNLCSARLKRCVIYVCWDHWLGIAFQNVTWQPDGR